MSAGAKRGVPVPLRPVGGATQVKEEKETHAPGSSSHTSGSFAMIIPTQRIVNPSIAPSRVCLSGCIEAATGIRGRDVWGEGSRSGRVMSECSQRFRASAAPSQPLRRARCLGSGGRAAHKERHCDVGERCEGVVARLRAARGREGGTAVTRPRGVFVFVWLRRRGRWLMPLTMMGSTRHWSMQKHSLIWSKCRTNRLSICAPRGGRGARSIIQEIK